MSLMWQVHFVLSLFLLRGAATDPLDEVANISQWSDYITQSSQPSRLLTANAPFGAPDCDTACTAGLKVFADSLAAQVTCVDSSNTTVTCVDLPIAILTAFTTPAHGGPGIAGFMCMLWLANEINTAQQLLPGYRIILEPFNSRLIVNDALGQLVAMSPNRDRYAALLAMDTQGSEAVVNNWQDKQLNMVAIHDTSQDVSIDSVLFPHVVTMSRAISDQMSGPVVALAQLVGWRQLAVVTSTGDNFVPDNSAAVRREMEAAKAANKIDEYLLTTVLWDVPSRADLAPSGGAAGRILESDIRVIMFQSSLEPMQYVLCELFKARRTGYVIFTRESTVHSHWWLDEEYLRNSNDPRDKVPTSNGCTMLQISTIVSNFQTGLTADWWQTGTRVPQSPSCRPQEPANLALPTILGWAAANHPPFDPTNGAVIGFGTKSMDMLCSWALAASQLLNFTPSPAPLAVTVSSGEELKNPSAEVYAEMIRLLQSSNFVGFYSQDILFEASVTREYPVITCRSEASGFKCFGWYTRGTMVLFADPGALAVWPGGNSTPPAANFPTCLDGSVRYGDGCIECLEPSQVYLQNLRQCTCAPGYKQNATYLTVPWEHPQYQCEACGPGYVSKTAGSAQCTACDFGTYSALANGTTCLVCDEGTYQSLTGQGSCTPCPAGFTNRDRESQDQCECPVGTFWYRPTSEAEARCEPCWQGLSCPGGTGPPRSAARFRAGNQTYPGSAPSFLVRCDNSRNCPDMAELGTCPLHREGIACDRCVVGYYEDGDDCVSCKGRNSGTPLVLFVIGVILGSGLLCIYATQGMGVKSASLMTMTITLGLIVNTLQSLGAFRSIDIDWPEPMKTIYGILALFTFSIELLNPGCVFETNSPTLKYLGSILAPPIVIIFLLALFGITAFVTNKVTRTHAFNTVGFVVLSFYTSLSVIAVLPWQCEKNPDGSSSIVTERGIQCFHGNHSAMLAISVFAILLNIVTFFTVISWATWVYPHRIQMPGGITFLRRFHFLFDRFRPKYFWFGVVYCVRNLVIALLPVLFANEIALQLLLMSLLFCLYLCILCVLVPWRSKAPTSIDAISCVGLIMILLGGALLVDAESQGSNTETVVIAFFIVVTLTVLLMVLCTVVYNLYLVVYPPKLFSAFLCHHKVGTAVLARWLKMELAHHTSSKIFLDSDDLVHLDTLFETVAFNTQNLVVLMSRQLLERIWCAGEITTALRYNVNIVRVMCDDYTEPKDAFINSLGELWTEDQKTHVARLGISVQQVQKAYREFREQPVIRWDRREPWDDQTHTVSLLLGRCRGMVGARLHTRFGSMAVGPKSSGSSGGSGDKKKRNKQQNIAAAPAKAEDLFRQANIMIIGEHSEPENFVLCVIIQGRLQQELELSTAIADSDSTVSTQQVAQAKCVVPLLTKGVLSNAEWALAVIAAIENGIMAIPLVADSGFVFPGPGFWSDLDSGKGLVATALQEQGVDLKAVSHAYQTLFACIAAHITPHGSEKGMRMEITDIARRYRHNLKHGWVHKDKDSNADQTRATPPTAMSLAALPSVASYEGNDFPADGEGKADLDARSTTSSDLHEV